MMLVATCPASVGDTFVIAVGAWLPSFAVTLDSLFAFDVVTATITFVILY